MSSSSTLSYLCNRINDMYMWQKAAAEHIENLESSLHIVNARIRALEAFVTSKGFHIEPPPPPPKPAMKINTTPHTKLYQTTPDTLPGMAAVTIDAEPLLLPKEVASLDELVTLADKK